MTFKPQDSLANSPNENPVRIKLLKAESAALPHILVLSLAIVLLHFTSKSSYLLLHSLVEVFRIAVLGAVFSVGWLSRRWVKKNLLVVLGVSSVFVGLIEILHTLSFKGLGIFPAGEANLPTQLWIAFRYFEALSVILALVLMRREMSAWRVLAFYSAITVILLVMIFGGIFPDCFVEGSGLTPFKIWSEYAIIALFGIGVLGLYLRRAELGHPFAPLMMGSVIAGMFAEVAFTRYVSVYGLANEIGHYFMLISAYLLYRAFVITGIAHPMDLLFDGLRRHGSELEQTVAQRTSELAKQTRRLNDILEGTNVGTWEWNVQTGETVFNERWAEIVGYKLAELAPFTIDTWSALVHPEDAERSKQLLSRHYSGELAYYECEARMRHKDGHWVWILDRGRVATWTNDGKPLVMSGTHQDISARKLMEEQLQQLAFHDPLTMLSNRRLFNDRLCQTIAANKRSGFYGAVVFLDLDNFKPLNDQHGHEVGDMLLIEVASRIKRSVREMDTVARFGGDEFVVLISTLGTDHLESKLQATIVAEKIRIALSEPYLLAINRQGVADTKVEHHCTASIGVALFANSEASVDDVVNCADAAMYEAKEAGRNLIRFANQMPG